MERLRILNVSSYWYLTILRKERVKETATMYTSKNEIDKILIEATSNENWDIANSKL